MLVLSKDEEEQWVLLKLLKETNPIETAEFAKSRGIEGEPAFAYWVPYVLRKRDRIISAIQSRINRATHKYGIEVPTSVDHARAIDASNGNNLWMQAIDKEMKQVAVASEIFDEGTSPPVRWSKSSGHLVFDVKMDFSRKARWVKDGHRTPEPELSTFAGVVSRESVRIALTYAAMNDIRDNSMRHQKCLSPGTVIRKALCGTWVRVWPRAYREGGPHSESPLWWQG